MFGRNPIAAGRRSSLLPTAVLVVAFAMTTNAQPWPKSNVEILGDLAIGCIGTVPDSLSSFVLESSDRMPYLRPRLTEYWRGRGQQVFLSDSLAGLNPPPDLSRMTYDPEDAQVLYETADEAQLQRTITLLIRYSLVAPTGLLEDEGRCRDEYSDRIGRGVVDLVQRDPFPETRAEVPPQKTWRTWAEPVVLAASVGVVAYLFFTIRSS